MRRNAFTLIELILVVVIISAIAVLGVPRYNKSAGIAREKAVLTALEIIHSANELYFVRNGTYHIPNEGFITSLASINAALGTDIFMDPAISFTYTADPGNPEAYTVTVTFPPSTSITISLSEEPLSSNPPDANPHCVGPCYVIPARST